ncbi:ADP-ribosylation_factor [Hexamita inflata]|uniref:ADP-ribosylation_factor n=1 Tax=Hexamita inflata TaxID=28002 RepID=A0ABP1LHL9_9EUKA
MKCNQILLLHIITYSYQIKININNFLIQFYIQTVFEYNYKLHNLQVSTYYHYVNDIKKFKQNIENILQIYLNHSSSIKKGSSYICYKPPTNDRCIRSLWYHYYQNTDFIIYVIDSSETDQYRINDAKEEIHEISNNNLIKDLPLIILANKSDIQILSNEEIIDLYNLDSISRVWKIFSTSIYDRESILNMVDWICTV